MVAGVVARSVGLLDQPPVQLGCEHVDLPGQLGVGLELQLLLVEVVIGLGLLERGLPGLAIAGS
jgi:hypothetical protein